MTSKAISSLMKNRELGWFCAGGVYVGVVLNVALHVRPYNVGGISGGVLSAVLVYWLA